MICWILFYLFTSRESRSEMILLMGLFDLTLILELERRSCEGKRYLK